jgi:cysteine desulfurase
MLYVKRKTKFQPYVIGGHQERGRRGGTENIPYIVGFGRAAELAMATFDDENTRVRALRDRLEQTILKTIPNTVRNGAREPRLPNTANIAFDFVEAEAVLMMLDQLGICASSGSACTTGSVDPSHVLTAMNLNPMRARGSVRFSLGIYNTADEVDYVLGQLPGIVARLRAISPLDTAHPDNDKFDLKAARQKHNQEASPSPSSQKAVTA